MMRWRRRSPTVPSLILIAGLLGVLQGCASGDVLQMDGFTLEKQKTEEMLADLQRRASFDMSCPAAELRLTILAVHDDAGADMPKQVGVLGCNKRATYAREYTQYIETGWALSGAGVEESTPSAASSSAAPDEAAKLEEQPFTPSNAAMEGTKSYSGIVHFGQIGVPLEWSTQLSTSTDPENVALAAQIREVMAKVSVEPAAPQRMKLLEELARLGGRRRLRLRELGEKEASVIMALMLLVGVWKHPEYRKNPPMNTSLVVVFPGTEARGTVYCDKLVNIVDDGGPGVDPTLLKLKDSCEAKELEAFMIVEAIADGGGVNSSHKCVAIAEAAGGSYKILLDCLKSRKYE